jgi:chemotaxis protein methyltransferase CheR
MRVLEEERIDRYFDRRGKAYAVRDEVKQLVDFYHLNLHTAPFPAEVGEIRDLDVIFCRNVMIYFPLPAVRQIVDKFAASLTSGGLLFLGHAETLFQISSRFERHTHGGGFYYRERKGRPAPPDRKVPTVPAAVVPPRVKRASVTATTAPPPVKSPPPPAARVRPEPVSRNGQGEVESLFRRAEVLFEAENFLEAKELLTEVLRRMPDHTGAMIIQGVIAANNGCFPESLEFCRRAKEADDLLPEAYFLNGVVLEMTDCGDEAMEEYRKAILLRMEFVMPHYFLGRLYFRAGRKADGVRELRNILKILEKVGGGVIIPFSGGISREVFLQRVNAELALVA